MCFSATASFAASALISTIGIMGYRRAGKSKVKILASIPICFGVQQFCEGWVWLALSHDSLSNLLGFFSFLFIVFAWVVWPFLIPWLLYRLEKKESRRKKLKVFLALGTVASLIMTYVIIYHGAIGSIQDCAIQYDFVHHWESWKWFGLLYIVTTVFSTFFSSIPNIHFFGLLNLVSYFITKIFWQDQVISVWCFLSAIASMIIYWCIVTYLKKEKGINY